MPLCLYVCVCAPLCVFEGTRKRADAWTPVARIVYWMFHCFCLKFSASSSLLVIGSQSPQLPQWYEYDDGNSCNYRNNGKVITNHERLCGLASISLPMENFHQRIHQNTRRHTTTTNQSKWNEEKPNYLVDSVAKNAYTWCLWKLMYRLKNEIQHWTTLIVRRMTTKFLSFRLLFSASGRLFQFKLNSQRFAGALTTTDANGISKKDAAGAASVGSYTHTQTLANK